MRLSLVSLIKTNKTPKNFPLKIALFCEKYQLWGNYFPKTGKEENKRHYFTILSTMIL